MEWVLIVLACYWLFPLMASSTYGYWYGDPSAYTLRIFSSLNKSLEISKYEALIADFGGIPADSAHGCYYPVIPYSACKDYQIDQAPPCPFPQFPAYAIVSRGGCNFDVKALNVQRGNYSGILIVNNGRAFVRPHGAGAIASQVTIPVFMVRRICGYNLVHYYPAKRGFYLVLTRDYFDMVLYLWPFAAVLGICLLVLLIAMLIKSMQNRQRLARRRLSRRNLKKIPTKKFTKGDGCDCCPICLEDFVEGEKLRVLPCNHVYHCACVDVWLTKNRKVCPVCKRKVLLGLPGTDSSSESDSERRRRRPRREIERRPLLQGNAVVDLTSIGNSTFYTSYQSLDNASVPGFIASSSNTVAGEPSSSSSVVSSSVSSSSIPRMPERSAARSRWDQLMGIFLNTRQAHIAFGSVNLSPHHRPHAQTSGCHFSPQCRLNTDDTNLPVRTSGLQPNQGRSNTAANNSEPAGYYNMTFVDENDQPEPQVVPDMEVHDVARRAQPPSVIGSTEGKRIASPAPVNPLHSHDDGAPARRTPVGLNPAGGHRQRAVSCSVVEECCPKVKFGESSVQGNGSSESSPPSIDPQDGSSLMRGCSDDNQPEHDRSVHNNCLAANSARVENSTRAENSARASQRQDVLAAIGKALGGSGRERIV